MSHPKPGKLVVRARNRARSLYLMFGAVLSLSCASSSEHASPTLSEACDDCLAREACATPWQLCLANAACEEHVVCVLRAECYTKPSTSRCISDAGCELASDAEAETREPSEDFEFCARTECTKVCGFVEP